MQILSGPRALINRTCFAVAATLLASGCAHGPREASERPLGATQYVGQERFFGSLKVHRYKLANGLSVLILEDHSSPTFAYHTWFKVGSMDEQKGLTGLAHLFEHMMFKATKNHPEGQYDRILDSAGAEKQNAFTSRDYTGYVQALPKSQLDLIMRMESDRMVNLVVEKAPLDKEREVVKNELRFRLENSPDGTMYERLFNLAFAKGHPYHWPVIGYMKDLDNAKVSECFDFYRNHYAPNNATVVVVGDVDRDETVSMIERYYGHFKPQPVQRYEGSVAHGQKSQRTDTLRLAIAAEKLYVGYHIPPLSSPDTPAVELLPNLVASLQSSRLYKRLVDAGIASKASAFTDSGKAGGLFIIGVSLQKGRTAAQALAAIDAEMARIRKSGFTADELQIAKNQYRYELFGGLDSNFSKAQNIGFFETVTGSLGRGVQIIDAIDALAADEVNAVARKVINKSTRTVLFGLPRGK